MWETSNDFFEDTQIDSIIDFMFEKHKAKIFLQNLLYVDQAVNVAIWEFYPDVWWVNINMYVIAGIILLIETL